MEKVYLALKMVELAAEKTKLESDCREGASLLRAMDVWATRGELQSCRAPLGGKARVTPVCSLPAAKMQPTGAEEGPADGTMQRPQEESHVHLQDAG